MSPSSFLHEHGVIPTAAPGERDEIIQNLRPKLSTTPACAFSLQIRR